MLQSPSKATHDVVLTFLTNRFQSLFQYKFSLPLQFQFFQQTFDIPVTMAIAPAHADVLVLQIYRKKIYSKKHVHLLKEYSNMVYFFYCLPIRIFCVELSVDISNNLQLLTEKVLAIEHYSSHNAIFTSQSSYV